MQPQERALGGGYASLDVDTWWGADETTLQVVHLHQARHYDGLTSARMGSALRPQAHEAAAGLRLVGRVMRALPSVDSQESAEALLRDVVRDVFRRLEVLKRGVETTWAEASAMEEELFLAPEVPAYLAGAMRRADAARPRAPPPSFSRQNTAREGGTQAGRTPSPPKAATRTAQSGRPTARR